MGHCAASVDINIGYGHSWTWHNGGTSEPLLSVATNGNAWVAVGDKGIILRSEDISAIMSSNS